MSSILQGNALTVLKTLKSESVHMMITSPPYYGLRNYKTDPLIWGGSESCQHEWIDSSWRNSNSSGGWQGGSQLGIGGSEGQKVADYNTRKIESQNCLKCGAWLGSLGNEPNPELYVNNLVQIFREVKRVLRPEGTAWLNIGDSYAANRSYQVADSKWKDVGNSMPMLVPPGLKPKDLVGIPWKLAFALQADGWWLRSDIIWAKGCSFGSYIGNPMPESVQGSSWTKHKIKIAKSERAKSESFHSLSQEGINTPQGARDGVNFKNHSDEYVDCPGCPKCSPNDGYILSWNAGRPTRAHEYIFLLTKSEKYFFDSLAIAEPLKRPEEGKRKTKARFGGADKWEESQKQSRLHSGNEYLGTSTGTRNVRSVWTIPNELENLFWEWYDSQEEQFTDVWTISTRGYREAHFACVDDETEALTPFGWKKYNELKPGTLIASYQKDKKELRWEPINDIAVYNYDGEIFVLGNRDLKFKVTPNHRCLVRTRKKNESVRLANSLVSGLKVPVAAKWSDGTFGGFGDPGPFMAGLLGWIITEGHYTKYGVKIYQSDSANPENVKKIRKSLNSCNIKFSERISKRLYKGRPSNLVTFSIGWIQVQEIRSFLWDKKPKWEMLHWSKESLFSLWDSMVSGDGHIRKSDGRSSFIQFSKETSDFFQALSIRLGLCAILSPRSNYKGYTVFTTNREWHSLRTTNGYSAITIEHYVGKVWCPSINSSFWLARRNGRIMITGNTFPVSLITPIIKAGSSEKGCPNCGMPWVRIIEKSGGRDWHQDKMVEKGIPGEILGEGGYKRGQSSTPLNDAQKSETIGWKATCQCNAGDPVPCTILDIFGGAGTSGVVATELGRKFILIELNPDYIEMAKKRIAEAAMKKLGD